MEHTKKAEAGQYLSFTLRGQAYGIVIGAVREINRMIDITVVPDTPNFVAGVINLRGKVIPVIDLCLKFNLGQTDRTRETCIIILQGELGQVGTIVDSVTSVIELQDAQIEPAPVLGIQDRPNFITGMGKLEKRVIILIDLVTALSGAHLNRITSLQPEKVAA